jgi:histone demethylase JARID1
MRLANDSSSLIRLVAGKLVCIQHSDELCSCPASRHCLRYRYTLNELIGLLTRLKDTITKFDMWSARVRSICESENGKRHGWCYY